MNPLNFKFLQVPVNLLAAVNFANVFLEIENVWKIKNVKKRDQNKKTRKKRFFTSMSEIRGRRLRRL